MLTIRLAFGTQKVSSFFHQVLAIWSFRITRGAVVGFSISFFSTSSLVGMNWFLCGKCRADNCSPGGVFSAFDSSARNSSGILSDLYSVPYHFSFLSQSPGKSRDTIVILILSGRRRLIPFSIIEGSNFLKRLCPLRSHSLGKGLCITEDILLVKRLAGVFCLNLNSTSAISFCSLNIHSCGGVWRSNEMYWKIAFTTSL